MDPQSSAPDSVSSKYSEDLCSTLWNIEHVCVIQCASLISVCVHMCV